MRGSAPSSRGRRGGSRQLALAAKAKIFLRLHQRHAEQMGEQIELVALGQSGEPGQDLGDKRHGLLRTAIANQIIRLRPPIPTGWPALHMTQ